MAEISIQGTNDLLSAFARLNSKQMKAVHKKTLNSVIGKLQTEAKRQLKQVTKRANVQGSMTAKGSVKQPLVKGITKKVWNNATGGTVTILGDYRLKWFEKGTIDRATEAIAGNRYSKKKKNTGRMKASYFFKKAIDSKQSSVQQEIENTLSTQIKKTFEGK
jgi:hypothetical protein